MHSSSEPQSLVKGIWNQDRAAHSVHNASSLFSCGLFRENRTFWMKFNYVLKTTQRCNKNKRDWLKYLPSNHHTDRHAHTHTTCNLKWLYKHLCKITSRFGVYRFSHRVSHLQRTARHWEKTYPGRDSHPDSSARFPPLNWGNWRSLVSPLDKIEKQR